MAEEQRPLLNGSAYDTGVPAYRTSKAKKILASAVVVTFITGLIVVMTQWSRVANSGDPLDIANRVLSRKGVIIYRGLSGRYIAITLRPSISNTELSAM
ncbi:hypothetical protein FRB95_001002 [Tulasnella sp. JGI-2019a]|nr:hypothetical protein FRB95_001002 [Tulasnella sp. JGI-2019a]